MKRIIGLFILTAALSLSSQAQKFGYVDTELILSKMEEYKAAKQEVDNLSQKWQKELEELKNQNNGGCLVLTHHSQFL